MMSATTDENLILRASRIQPRSPIDESLKFPALNAPEVPDELKKPLKVCVVIDCTTLPSIHESLFHDLTDLALLLQKSGHEVTVAFPPGVPQKILWRWPGHLKKCGIHSLSIPKPDIPLADNPISKTTPSSYALYEWLKTQSFDIVHLPMLGGIGYYSLLARQLGVAFHNTRMCLHVVQPTIARTLANAQSINDWREFITIHSERRCVELADTVLSPGTSVLQWMQGNGFKLPEGNTFVEIPPTDMQHILNIESWDGKVEEIVYIGPLLPRRGLHLFCDAVSRLNKDQGKNIKVIFVCENGGKKNGRKILERHTKDWQMPWRIKEIHDWNKLIRFVSKPGRLSVLLSTSRINSRILRALLALKLPFVASEFEEIGLVDENSETRSLFTKSTPWDLSELLNQALEKGVKSPSVSWNFEETNKAWVRWHAALASNSSANSKQATEPTPSSDGDPLVSVCLTHYNRPVIVHQAIASLKRQTYKNFEVILVDDGSNNPKVPAVLDKLEAQFKPLGWQVIRQENRYLGAARNTAARHARGEYLFFMDDDNVAKPHELETFVHAARTSGADILTCFSDQFRGTEAPTDQTPIKRLTLVGDNLAVGAFMNGFGDANALVRRSIFEEIGGYTEDFRVGLDDQEFFARAILHGHRLEIIPEALYYYRMSKVRMKQRHYDPQTSTLRSLRPYINSAPLAYRDLLLYAVGMEQRLKRMRLRAVDPNKIGIGTLLRLLLSTIFRNR